MKTLEIVSRFAKSRENAYRLSGMMTASKVKAITTIRQKASFFSAKGDQVQLKVVAQLEPEILAILPDERSRFSKLRADILHILHQAKSHQNGQNLLQSAHD
jgi:Glu-tRNA(Gln) amidotransferase subunit E-like FAD-binding protein